MSETPAFVTEIELGMTAALDAARHGFEVEGEVPIGAATVRNGVVTSARHTEEVKQRRRLVHADLLALQDADLPGLSIEERAVTTLVVTLEPCLLCIGAAIVFGVGHVHFALLKAFVASRSAGGLWRWARDTVESIDALGERVQDERM